MTTPGSTLRVSLLTTLALTAGYVGGSARGWLDHAPPIATVRARRFELVDGAGRAIAVLAPNPTSLQAQSAGATLVIADPRGVRRCQLGFNPGDGGPFLRLYGSDGAKRVDVGLGPYDDPVLTLRDGRKVRAVLGARHGDMPGPGEDNWSLSLYARKERAGADIGFFNWWDDTYHAGITLRDGAGRKWEAAAGAPLKPLHSPNKR